MARLLAYGFTISLDGYGADPRQSVENPLGVGGEALDLPALGYQCTEGVPSAKAVHYVIART